MDLPTELQEVAALRANISGMSQESTERLFGLLARSNNRTLTAAIVQTLHAVQHDYPGLPILYHTRICDSLQNYQPSAVALMCVLDVFGVENKGTFVSGYIVRGDIGPSDELVLLKADGRDMMSRCLDTTTHPSLVTTLLLEDLRMGEVSQGDCIVRPAL